MTDWIAYLFVTGRANVPERIKLVIPDHGVTLFKPAHISSDAKEAGGAGTLAIKVVSVRPGNAAKGLPTVPAVVLCLDPLTGALSGVLDGTYLTGLRTAAGSAVAARILAPASPQSVVVFGAGLQGKLHAEALLQASVFGSSLKSVTFVNRSAERAQAVCVQLGKQWPGVAFAAVASASADAVERATRDADIVVTATGSSTPVFDGQWLRSVPRAGAGSGPAALVLAVGSYMPNTRELDTATVAAADIVIDSEEARAAGDIAIAEAELRASATATATASAGAAATGAAATGAAAAPVLSVAGTLGQVLEARRDAAPWQGRALTIFKSVGTAVQDAATASAVLERLAAGKPK